ncbi:hypothetical protein BEL07_27325 [Mycolicibacterium grossiae]|uniref:HTTM domain-containing protein n=1 Tax=Mycolicibacterium grossiae TaxID=1552759 RepID=A0A1E8PWQ9_9MYCO|nr:hypothetical protein BEL07_27325 [Mycolicibacterium grossiae]
MIITVAAARVVASGGMMLVSPFTSYFTASIAVLTVAMLYQSYRSSMGTEGSDQMFAIIAIALLLGGNAFASPLAAKVCLAFIVLQAVLSYTTSGIAKLISPIWRSGSALPAVLSTHSHGLPAFGRLLSKHRNVALLANWFVIVFEASFALAIVSPNLALLYISAGVVLHVSIAYTMGLNLFLFAFTATYPAVFWAAESLRLREMLLS